MVSVGGAGSRLTEGPGAAGARRPGVVGEDRLLQLPERGRGLEAELLVECLPRCAIGLERLGLAAAAVQRQHELATQPLAQRMLPHERLELADQLRVPSAAQVGLDAVLEQCEPQLLEPADLRLRERLEDEIGERRSAPERQRLPQLLGGPPRVFGGQSLAALVGQALASVEVELARLHVEQVAIRLGHQPGGALSKSLAQPRHLDLEALPWRGGRVLAPELVDQLVGRDGLVGMDQQDREQRTLPAVDDRDRPPGLFDLERAEDPEIHGSTLPP